MNNTITDDMIQSRFELIVDGHTAFANYTRKNDVLTILHVEAPPELRGTGVAGTLMQGIMEKARAENLKILPICGYAAAWLRKHAEYHALLHYGE